MGSELEISFGIAKIKVSLAEFLTAIKQITGAVKHQEVKQTLKEMIEEVRKSYDATVDAFTPLYGLDTHKKFNGKFSNILEDYKKKYLKDIGNMRAHCTIVAQQIEALKKRKSWMKNLPLVKKSFNRLQDVGNFWFLSDYTLTQEMETFLNKMNQFLNDINEMRRKNRGNAFRHLQLSLEQFEDDFNSIKQNLDNLEVISSKL